MRRVLVGAALVCALAATPASAAEIVVTRLADDTAPGSLRSAITAANLTDAADVITFAPGVTGTINLLSALPDITKPLTIQAPGASSLTVRRAAEAKFRIFHAAVATATLSLSGLTIANGHVVDASPNGGGGVVAQAPLTLSHVVAKDNLAESTTGVSVGAGGVLALVGATISHTRVTNNVARYVGVGSGLAFGGGLYLHGPFTLDSSTIDGNTASTTSVGAGYGSLGGGLFSAASSDTGVTQTITRSTVSGNTIAGGHADATRGAGIANHNYSALTITNSTIAENTGGPSAVHNTSSSASGRIFLRSSIISDNDTTAACVSSAIAPPPGTITSLGNNVVEDGSCQPTSSDKSNVDALLRPLGDNGGPTPTHALTTASPAVDAGVAAGAGLDQRGQARTVDHPQVPQTLGSDGTDSGAFELNDVLAPETTITSAPSAVNSSAVFSFSSSEDGTFECQIDGEAFFACASPHAVGLLAEGVHFFRVRAIDTVGNADQTPASAAWTMDTTRPDTTITSSPPSATTATSAMFTFAASEAGASFSCRLDNGEPQPCTSPQSFTSLAPGTHVLVVTAIDPAGNRDDTPAVFAWTVSAPAVTDRTPPDTRITKGPRVTRSRTPIFKFTATERGAMFRCKLDKGRYKSCRSGRRLARLKRGRHVLRVVAVDLAGNVDPTPAVRRFRIR